MSKFCPNTVICMLAIRLCFLLESLGLYNTLTRPLYRMNEIKKHFVEMQAVLAAAAVFIKDDVEYRMEDAGLRSYRIYSKLMGDPSI